MKPTEATTLNLSPHKCDERAIEAVKCETPEDREDFDRLHRSLEYVSYKMRGEKSGVKWSMRYQNGVCKACKSNTPPYCGTCPYRFCESQKDADFVTKLCSDLRRREITDRQFTIRYKKRFGHDDRCGDM